MKAIIQSITVVKEGQEPYHILPPENKRVFTVESAAQSIIMAVNALTEQPKTPE